MPLPKPLCIVLLRRIVHCHDFRQEDRTERDAALGEYRQREACMIQCPEPGARDQKDRDVQGLDQVDHVALGVDGHEESACAFDQQRASAERAGEGEDAGERRRFPPPRRRHPRRHR